MTDHTTMNKTQLRAACKEAAVPGYGNMTTDAMRAALAGMAAPPAPTKVEQNGINRPRVGGKLDAVWTALDAMLAETGAALTLKEAKALAAEKCWAAGTLNVQFYRWKKFTAA